MLSRMDTYHGKKDPARVEAMVTQFRSGQTLQEIGDQYQLTRERVRQILASAGITREEGGASIKRQLKSSARERANKARRDASAIAIYGCTHDELMRCNEHRPLCAKGAASRMYSYQRKNAFGRGIPFKISFPDWLRVWQESGKFNMRGCGHNKYVMSRFGDKGAYEVGNVFIQDADQNNREYALRRYGKEKLAA